MASYNQSGGDPNGHLNAMLARLQASRSGSNASDDNALRELPARLSSFNLGRFGQQSEGAESPMMAGSDVFPPPAPTPPTGQFPHSHMPPNMMGLNLGPIGSMPPTASARTDQSTNLLNLLKYNGGSGNQPYSRSQSPPSIQHHASSLDGSLVQLPHTTASPTLHAPVPMAADPQGFLASLMKGTDAQAETPRSEIQPSLAPAAPPKWNAAPPAEDTQAYLLNLLRKKPDHGEQPTTNESSQQTILTPQSTSGPLGELITEEQMEEEPIAKVGQDVTPLSVPFGSQPWNSAKLDHFSPSSQHDTSRKPGSLDHNNPFEDMRPVTRGKTPKSTTSSTAPPIQILKKAPSHSSSPSGLDHGSVSSYRSQFASPEQGRQKIESPTARGDHPTEFSGQNKQTVSEAIDDLAEKADRDVQETLATIEGDAFAEPGQAAEQQTGQDVSAMNKLRTDLEEMVKAKTDAEFDAKSEVAARDLQKELAKDENAGLLEEALPAEAARAVRGIVDEAANGQGAVADSWESAEADEIVVIEEPVTPTKVYNFPMRPWISISLLDNDKETRPQFREEVILDIARIKKEFDQIDRNLVSATETYIVYGMSKAGGLRVIRQDDGRDVKLFTDTKDRVFNVAVSSTPSDLMTARKESIIGTGISGTVYYVLIKNDEKDYLEDAHPEQYGFILPPTSLQDGDAPGGVLKTRARTSSTHPDYFAVGRGKTISIIWPSYILKNNLFKPGHDRVVDTERLLKQCSLRINTGKAGKDFTFSQDDTTIVSLDKSGRVKFWDVRDLTAVDEDSDPRFPMPARTSLEVKEPLMTLTTTPEGEKAWPTSVLLLDKQRPYQKRCALRYMIVGMKQNHTLQLWDLALGKPVQEFNLPHSKESDAVCSVMYHPPTGMIVVGHPTRNSIYFLHLSAPKYSIKGLSQVDYIQKLVSKDSSIPEPDSTAVISGVREYSFSQKGILRSLDMLGNPTTSSDDDEPTLFELYAMHSKGVSGISVKQFELGWTKDNKVQEPVDAVEAGIVKITKLKELPAAPFEPPTEESSALPIRIAARSSLKESTSPHPHAQPASSEESGRRLEEPAPAKAELPVTPQHQLEKSERKARKKKDKAAAAAAAAEKHAADHAQSNGFPHSPQFGPTSKNFEPKDSSSFLSPPAVSAASPESFQPVLKQFEASLSSSLNAALETQRQKMEIDSRNRDSSFNKRQQELLDLVSSTLDSNVQAVLTRTITDKVEDHVVPALSEVINHTVSEQLGRIVSEQLDSKISGRISHAIQNQMQKLLPGAVNQALQKPEIAKAVTDKVVRTLAINIENSFQDTLNKTIIPTFSRMATAAAADIANDVQQQAAAQVEELEQKLRVDSNKIDQLTALVTRLSDTVSAMAQTQAQFQDGFMKNLQQASQHRQSQSGPVGPRSARESQYAPSETLTYNSQPSQRQPQPYASPSAHSGNQIMPYSGQQANRDRDFERKLGDVQGSIERGELEAALVKWLQSDRKEEIYQQYLSKLNPTLLKDLSPLVSLAAIAEVARELDGTLLREKIGWMEVIVHSIHGSLPHIEPQVREVIPNILSGFVSQIEHLFMRVSQAAPTEPILKHLSTMVAMANRIIEVARNPNLAGY